ncbi:MAG: hypothetical protein KVP17_004572 [Porospora cf. gigantea B]|uniref:uncharacterized protein n=1 Tax=Porospora cf. gigantea B TaxID=2853592 RepID=UPI003571CE0E|nr:MAG: hypothetical protein KVP17_004572 [Porospora cf. gigantea B]
MQRRLWEADDEDKDKDLEDMESCLASMTLRDRKKAVDGDTGQAERLLLQKQSPKNSDQRDPRVKCVDA